MITVISRKYDGSIGRSWTCELLERRGSLLVFIGRFDSPVDHADLGHIPKGTISYEFYWLDRWYNVFRFHQPSGELKNYYFNICMPPTFENDVLDYIDLDIDVLVTPDRRYTVLDRGDFERNTTLLGYPDEVCVRVEETLEDVQQVIDAGHVPGAPELFATSATEVRESR